MYPTDRGDPAAGSFANPLDRMRCVTSTTSPHDQSPYRNMGGLGAFAGGIVPKEEKKAPPVTLGVVAIWVLALAFGVAFWAVLFYVASAIVGQIC
jgi:hypothetical protein